MVFLQYLLYRHLSSSVDRKQLFSFIFVFFFFIFSGGTSPSAGGHGPSAPLGYGPGEGKRVLPWRGEIGKSCAVVLGIRPVTGNSSSSTNTTLVTRPGSSDASIYTAVAYLGFHKGGAKFSLATSAYTKGAKPGFPKFFLCQQIFFCQRGAMAQWPP